MALRTIFAVSLLMGIFAAGACQDPPQAASKARSGQVRVVVDSGDSVEQRTFEQWAASAEAAVSKFFGAGFKRELILRVCPSRLAFDAALKEQWGMPKTERWMVGAAGGTRGFFLSPKAWRKEADGHDPADLKAIQMIVSHELTHSYHAQHSPTNDLDGMDDMAWFAEGLATYVSGQEGSQHRGRAKQELAHGRFPNSLKEVWTGSARYGLAGSLVRFVDERFGRSKIRQLLAATSNAAALKLLGTDEPGLLAGWRDWLSKSEPESRQRVPQ